MEQIDQIMQAERSVEVAGVKVIVHEVTMKHLKAFAAACAPFLSEFDEAGKLSIRTHPDGTPIPPDDFALFKVLSEHSDAFMQAAAMVSNAPVAWLERLRPDQFFDIAALVVEVNGDFFVRNLAPALIRFARGLGMIGTMLYTASLPQATVI